MCYFYSVRLLLHSPLGCQAIGQGTLLANDLLLNTSSIIHSQLINNTFICWSKKDDNSMMMETLSTNPKLGKTIDTWIFLYLFNCC